MTGTGDMALNVNFGNGYFGTTAVSSAETNASNKESSSIMFQQVIQLYQKGLKIIMAYTTINKSQIILTLKHYTGNAGTH